MIDIEMIVYSRVHISLHRKLLSEWCHGYGGTNLANKIYYYMFQLKRDESRYIKKFIESNIHVR
jgi:hypothetical protein